MSLLTSLVSYWKLDEASGDALDAHGSNPLTEHGTGGVGSAAGIISNARDFENNDLDYFSHADDAAFSPGDTDFTFNLWLNAESIPTGGNYPRLVTKWSAGQREYECGLNGDSTRFFWEVSSDGTASVVKEATTFGAPSAATWYMLTVWHDSVNNQIGIAVNAGTADTAAHSTGVFDGTEDFRIGVGDTPNFNSCWDGLIDEVGFWKRVLTSDERTQLYNSGNGIPYENFGEVGLPPGIGGSFPIRRTYRPRPYCPGLAR